MYARLYSAVEKVKIGKIEMLKNVERGWRCNLFSSYKRKVGMHIPIYLATGSLKGPPNEPGIGVVSDHVKVLGSKLPGSSVVKLNRPLPANFSVVEEPFLDSIP